MLGKYISRPNRARVTLSSKKSAVRRQSPKPARPAVGQRLCNRRKLGIRAQHSDRLWWGHDATPHLCSAKRQWIPTFSADCTTPPPLPVVCLQLWLCIFCSPCPALGSTPYCETVPSATSSNLFRPWPGGLSAGPPSSAVGHRAPT